MRFRTAAIACVLASLGGSGGRAVANGVIVVATPLNLYYLKTEVVHLAPAASGYKGHLHRLCKPGTASSYVSMYYEVVQVQGVVAVSNPLRPCFKPPPTPSPQSPHPSPQSPHDHASPSPQSAAADSSNPCGECWPRCFRSAKEDRCKCCTHYKRTVPAGSSEANAVVQDILINHRRNVHSFMPHFNEAIADAIEASDPSVPDPFPCPPKP